MGDLLIRNVPEAMKLDIAELAEKNGNSLSDEAKNLLRKGMIATHADMEPNGGSTFDAIRRAFVDAGASGDEFAKIMDEIEAERKTDFGRPVEDFE
ncbi:plasmid stabilization protein [Neorhizobium sp. P12A]|uniref:plasmid stabilization protein n=1 Tax=Neorhizobium sp. P12A TaxID=2268027 RepID=UPI0011EDB882|nr:plasmid stabilization protein [Neorhizobium sp. P12A]KAA0699333.1 plasmid stabilization protein [Neorhizobium sp. P12A]